MQRTEIAMRSVIALVAVAVMVVVAGAAYLLLREEDSQRSYFVTCRTPLGVTVVQDIGTDLHIEWGDEVTVRLTGPDGEKIVRSRQDMGCMVVPEDLLGVRAPRESPGREA